jgi:SAM-dependent methyltransferase
VARGIYRADLAAIHHEGFGELVRKAAPVLLAAFHRAGLRGGPVVDLGCGSGLFLHELARAGYRAVGVDPSAAMIDLARKVEPRATLHRASAHRFALPGRCQAVTALGEALQYLPSADAPAPSLPALFAKVARALLPGGMFVFDLLVAEGGPPMAYRTFRQGRSWVVLIEVEEAQERGRLFRTITTFRREGARYRREEERHALQVPKRAEVEQALRAAGFEVRVRRTYGSARLAPRRRAFWAHLPLPLPPRRRRGRDAED